MKAKKILQFIAMSCALVLSTTASALYIDVGAPGAGGLNDSLFGGDADTKTGSIDSIIFNISGGIPLADAGTGLAVGLNMTDTFDSDKEFIGSGLTNDITIAYDSILSTISLDFNATNVATFTMTSFGSTSGFTGAFTSVLDGFWFLDDGSALTNALISDVLPTTIDMTFNASNTSIDAALVPEPSILALFGLGLAGMGFASRRRNKL